MQAAKQISTAKKLKILVDFLHKKKLRREWKKPFSKMITMTCLVCLFLGNEKQVFF